MKKICQNCGKEYTAPPSIRKVFCSEACHTRKRERNSKWHGGRLINDWYVYILKPEHPNATKLGYVLEHRLVMEEELGRLLTAKEVVHHINHDKSDNRPENLMLFQSPGQHFIQEHFEARTRSGRFKKARSLRPAH